VIKEMVKRVCENCGEEFGVCECLVKRMDMGSLEVIPSPC
jgi:hypothetical protein